MIDPTKYLFSGAGGYRELSPADEERQYSRIGDEELHSIERDADTTLSRLFAEKATLDDEGGSGPAPVTTSFITGGGIGPTATDSRGIYVYNALIESETTLDAEVRINYDCVPNVPLFLQEMALQECEKLGPAACTTTTAFNILYCTINGVRTMPEVEAFGSVTSFGLEIRPRINTTAHTLDVWTREVLPRLTVHHSVIDPGPVCLEAYGLLLPCRALFITINVYAFVFFERVCRPAFSAHYDFAQPLMMIGCVVVHGANV